jgi:acyl carrier protein
VASFTEIEMRALLVKVGLNPVPPNAIECTFGELGLDSLARIEIATRLRESYGAEVEAELMNGEDLALERVVAMVNASVTPATR